MAAGARKAPWFDDECRRKRRDFFRSLRDGREDLQDKKKDKENIRGGLHANSQNNRLLFFWTS